MTSISADSTNATKPNLIMQYEPPLHSGPVAPTTVFQPMTAMAMTGTISNSEFIALKVGSQTGTGAPTGTPRIEPKMSSVQNANSA